MVYAALTETVGQPPRLTEIDLVEPGPGQIRIRLTATGVCHTDFSLSAGTVPHLMPAVLGHEAAGVVTAVGANVTDRDAGDPVLLIWAPACGTCRYCTYRQPYLCRRSAAAASVPHAALRDGTPVYPGMGIGAFAEETVVPARATVPLPAGIPPAEAAVLGCAALTGFGAVRRTAGVAAGDSVVVIGAGAVGLCAVRAAALAGAGPVIVVDANQDKSERALAQGATHFLPAGPAGARDVLRLTSGLGADHVVECVGSARTIRLAWDLTRRGGVTTIVGIGASADLVRLPAQALATSGRTLRGCVYGSSRPAEDVPELAALVRDGQFRPADLITHTIGLADLPAAFARLDSRSGGRSLIVF
ncbi:zinc-binding dehydrogenase [Micromonospora sp. C95]|uniref:zinc-binding dehydrogenase n=1 Tax=Micromonospora sp. C95 TaxID=2824882 RepID=UPI001B38A929|nr:zinc-binding dehydrogenase [Micromonospora sp. C95]MBQ1026052.1 alcohol dehydrogenase catalytic domain-containing protein [Micromonospora sp. C95]